MELDNEVVVKFQSELRKVTMYFTKDKDGSLNMQMSIFPELDQDNSKNQDLCMRLAGVFFDAVKAQRENEDDINPKVYDGQD